MTGLSKITDKILAEAREDARVSIAEAEEKASAIRAEYAVRAEELKKQIDEDAKRQAEEIVFRAKADEAMIRKNARLSTRGEMVDEAFSLAKREILNLSPERYLEFLSMLLARAIRQVAEDERVSRELYGDAEETEIDLRLEVLLNERDREQMGAELMEKIADKQKVGEIDRLPILSEENAPIDGGLILRQGRIEINCSVKALFEELRPEWEGRVAARLFAEKKG